MTAWIPLGVGMLILKATLLLTVAAGISHLLRRAAASVRHLVWTGAILAVLLLPAADALLPSWRVLPARPAPVRAQAAADPVSSPVLSSRPSTVNTAPVGTAPVRAAPVRIHPVFAVWAVGTLVLFARFAWGLAMVWWIARRAEQVMSGVWLSRLAQLSTRMGVKRPVRLLRSPWTRMPMTFGVSQPVIVLPAEADRWSAERSELVLLHELAHIRRRDALTLGVAQVVRALHWFNPLSWVALHRLRAEAECACDDAVLNAGMRASTYADHLLDLVRQVGRAPIPAAAVLPMARRKGFEGRLLAILEPSATRDRVRPLHAALASALTLGLLLMVGALTPERATAIPVLDTAGVTRGEPAQQEAAAEAEAEDVAEPSPSAVQQPVADPSVVRELVTAMADSDVGVRLAAVQALGNLQDTASVRALMRALRSDSDAGVRRMAAWALGNIESDVAVDALGEALARDDNVEVRATAAWALGNIESERAVDALVAALSARDVEVRKQSVWALGQIESARAVPGLTRLLEDASPEVREQAVWALGQIESEDAVPALLRLLRDGNEDVRKQTAWALGQIEAASSTEGLAQVLASDQSAAVRQEAAWALGQVEPATAPRALLDAVRDRSVEVRRTAVWALAQIEDRAAIPALREALKDADAEVRRNAVRALADLDDPAAKDALVEMLKSDDPAVRRDAAGALGGRGGWSVDPRPQPQPRPQPRPGGVD